MGLLKSYHVQFAFFVGDGGHSEGGYGRSGQAQNRVNNRTMALVAHCRSGVEARPVQPEKESTCGG